MGKLFARAKHVFIKRTAKKLVESEGAIKYRPLFRSSVIRDDSALNPNFYRQAISDISREIPFDNPIIVCDNVTKGIVGERFKEDLESTLKSSAWLEIVNINNVCEKNYTKFAKDHDFNSVFAIGGGKIIDFCKGISYVKNKSLIVVPTAPSHDGIASGCLSRCEDSGEKKTVRAKRPNAIIVDFDLWKNAPEILVQAGFGDVAAKCSALKDWRLANMEGYDVKYSGEAREILGAEVELLIEVTAYLGRERYRRNNKFYDVLLTALVTSGDVMSSCEDSSVPASGSEHALAHAFDRIFPEKANKFPHGIKTGFFTIYTSYLQDVGWWFVKKGLESIGIPTDLKSYGLSVEEFMNVVRESKREGRYTILDKVGEEKKIKAISKIGYI